MLGYTNASWTLKTDLVAEFVCRLLERMDRDGHTQCVPVDDGTIERRPLLDFQAGYVQRSIHEFPQGGASAPWKLAMSYPQDVVTLRHRSLDDGALRFSYAVATARRPRPAATLVSVSAGGVATEVSILSGSSPSSRS